MKRILVLGGGFAGLWSAVGAARKLDELGVGPGEVAVTLVNRDAWHCIRVRNYEADLRDVRLPLDDVLGPIGVARVEAEVTAIDLAQRQVSVQGASGPRKLAYDRLVFALGSRLVRPELPGLAEHAFDVDTWAGGQRLNDHVAALASRAATVGQYTALVVGSGLTGVEAATELAAKLRAAIGDAGASAQPRVILADHGEHIGSNMGAQAVAVIAEALANLGIETRTGVAVAAIDADGATLASGERIDAATVVWCGGMRANPLTAAFPVAHDRFGRIPVDAHLKVKRVEGVFAAGDVSSALLDDRHVSVMSCQHGRPMGRFAGHNVVCDVLGLPMLPLRIDWYTTILDLGAWGAVYTEGWDRRVVTTGAAAKKTKRLINRERIYPPRSRDRRRILDAAAPVVQEPPPQFATS